MTYTILFLNLNTESTIRAASIQEAMDQVRAKGYEASIWSEEGEQEGYWCPIKGARYF